MTPTPEQISAALKNFNHLEYGKALTVGGYLGKDGPDVIRFALRFAERALGEPSEEAVAKGYLQIEAGGLPSKVTMNTFKAMRDQICAEIGENDGM